jgi:predicted nucleotidyltransferase
MHKNLDTILSRLRHQLEELYGSNLVGLRLYGSQARGEAVFGSDIDVLVILEDLVSPAKEVHRTSGIVAGLSLEYDVVISCAFISQNQLLTEQSPFLMNVQREGIVV